MAQGFDWNNVNAPSFSADFFKTLGEQRQLATAQLFNPVSNFITTVRDNNTADAIAEINRAETFGDLVDPTRQANIDGILNRAVNSNTLIDVGAVQKAQDARASVVTELERNRAVQANLPAMKSILGTMAQGGDILPQDLATLNPLGLTAEAQRQIGDYGINKAQAGVQQYNAITGRMGTVVDAQQQQQKAMFTPEQIARAGLAPGEQVLPMPQELDQGGNVNVGYMVQKQEYDAQQARMEQGRQQMYSIMQNQSQGRQNALGSLANALSIGGQDLGVLANNVQNYERGGATYDAQGTGFINGRWQGVNSTLSFNGEQFSPDRINNMNIIGQHLSTTPLSQTAQRIMFANIGRENNFKSGVISGYHRDPKVDRENSGIISYSYPSRKNAFEASMRKQGVINANGTFNHSPENVQKQLDYVMHDLQTNYKKQYAVLTNPNSTEAQARTAIDEFIGWDTKLQSGHDAIKHYNAIYTLNGDMREGRLNGGGGGSSTGREVINNAVTPTYPQATTNNYVAPTQSAPVTATPKPATASGGNKAYVMYNYSTPKDPASQATASQFTNQVPDMSNDPEAVTKWLITGDPAKGEIATYNLTPVQGQVFARDLADASLVVNKSVTANMAKKVMDANEGVDRTKLPTASTPNGWLPVGETATRVKVYNRLIRRPEYQAAIKGTSSNISQQDLINVYEDVHAQAQGKWMTPNQMDKALSDGFESVVKIRVKAARADRESQLTAKAIELGKKYNMSTDNVMMALDRMNALQKSSSAIAKAKQQRK